MRLLQALAGLFLLTAAIGYGYSLSMDTTVTTSDQNVVQSWAGLLLVTAATVGLVPLLVAAARQDRGSADLPCHIVPARVCLSGVLHS